MMEANLKIFMLGARRCGKSSTLASMISSLATINSQNIKVSIADETTRKYLEGKQTEMKDIFSQDNLSRGYWSDNAESGDQDMTINSLDITIHNSLTFHATCTDIPGEIIKNDMSSLINVSVDCDVLIFAIDTPQLMVNGYNGVLANYVTAFYEFCKILVYEHGMREKRIILVPLKCEKYVHKNEMDNVAKRVKSVYKELIELWKTKGKSDCFIIPVQTLGNLEFDHYEYVSKVGDIAYYRYYGQKNYSPENCEQPFIFAIDYAINKLSWKPKWYQKTLNYIVRIMH